MVMKVVSIAAGRRREEQRTGAVYVCVCVCVRCGPSLTSVAQSTSNLIIRSGRVVERLRRGTAGGSNRQGPGGTKTRLRQGRAQDEPGLGERSKAGATARKAKAGGESEWKGSTG